MKKICLVIHSLGIGGMERVMSQLADDFFSRDDIKVDVILIGRKREVVYPLDSSIAIHKPPFEFNNRMRAYHTLRTILFLRSKVKELNPDTVLSFGEYWNNLVLLALYRLSFPVFISDRSEPDKDLGRLQNFLRDILYPQAAGYVAQTTEAKNVCLAKNWNKNIEVIGNPIRPILRNGQVERENIVLSVGRLIPTKHFDQMIRSFVELGRPGWKLVIVGGDAKNMTLSKDLKRLVQELGAQDAVFLEGEQKDIDSYYQKSKIFAFTSSSEGFPNVIGEALSAGMPVVSFDCVAGPSEMIQDGKNGFLIPLFDYNFFKEKLSDLMMNEDLRTEMAEVAKGSVEEFTTCAMADRFYHFIISNNKQLKY